MNYVFFSCVYQKKAVLLWLNWIINHILVQFMNRNIAFVFLIASLMLGCTHGVNDEEREMNTFIDNLMGRMTLEEKLGQLNLPVGGDIVTGEPRHSQSADGIRQGRVGGLFNLKGAKAIREVQRIAVEESRLGIPLLFGMDVIHGYETVFPIPLAMSCSWDMAAIESSARIAAREATADGICWTFSPMVDVCHDGRWGRISEGSGEDPYLGSRVAEAMVRGYQGSSLADSATVMACVKHFAAYGLVEAGREYNNVYPDDYHLFNEYMQPYKAAFDAGAGSAMAAFNTVHGVPCTGNKWLLTDLLRDQWGFRGFVVSDYTGLEELWDNGVCPNKEESAIQSLEAGLDMDMVSEGLVNLAAAVREGRCSEKAVDAACRRILEAKYKLGLFDDPYRYCDTTKRGQVILCAAHRAEARRIAGESMVLLKNEDNILPLKPDRKGLIAIIGPNANAMVCGGGSGWVNPEDGKGVTLYEGLSRLGKNYPVCLLGNPDPEVLRKASVVIVSTGFDRDSETEGRDRSYGFARRFVEQIETVASYNSNVVVVANSGGEFDLEPWAGKVKAIVLGWYPGQEGGNAIAALLTGKVSPSGRLPLRRFNHQAFNRPC